MLARRHRGFGAHRQPKRRSRGQSQRRDSRLGRTGAEPTQGRARWRLAGLATAEEHAFHPAAGKGLAQIRGRTRIALAALILEQEHRTMLAGLGVAAQMDDMRLELVVAFDQLVIGAEIAALDHRLPRPWLSARSSIPSSRS